MLTPDERANAYAAQLGRNAVTIHTLIGLLMREVKITSLSQEEELRIDHAKSEADRTLDEIESAYERNRAVAQRVQAVYRSALREPEQFDGMSHAQAAALRPTATHQPAAMLERLRPIIALDSEE